MAYGTREREATVYFSAKNGKFKYKLSRSDSTHRECDFVSGHLVQTSIVYKPAHEEIAAHDELQITLQGSSEDGKPERYMIQGHFPGTFAHMFAAHLPHIAVGEKIGIAAWGGADNAKVTCCGVETAVGQGENETWRRVGRQQDAPKVTPEEIDEQVRKATAGLQGQALARATDAIKEEIRKASTAAKGAWARKIIEAHPSYLAPDAKEEVDLDEDAGDGADRLGQRETGDPKEGGASAENSQASASAAHTPSGSGSVSTEASQTSANAAPAEASAFGWSSPMWPAAELWATDATEAQKAKFAEMAVQRFKTEPRAEYLAKHLLEHLGVGGVTRSGWKKGHYMVILAFTVHATAAQEAALVKSAYPQGEYDPFEDE